jgi:branched-chain amino acid transport system substrate-binding protein
MGTSRGWNVVVVLVSCVALLGCEKKTEHVLGAILPVTGVGAAYGADIKRGMELELEAINDAGGINGLPLRIVFEDSGSDPAQGEAAARRLIGESRVPAIIGAALSSVTLAVAPVAEESEVVLLSPAASHPKISEAGNYIYRIYPSDVVEGTMMAEFALNVMGMSRIVVLAANNDYGQGLKTVFIKRYRTVPNRDILEVINFPEGKTDWSDVLTGLQQQGPDGVYLVGYPEEMLSFLQALREANFGVPILSSRSFNADELMVPEAEGVIFPRDPFNPERTDRARSFAEAYRAKYGAEPEIWAANGADSVRLIAEALQNGAEDAEGIRRWLQQVRDWEGACGILTFDGNGDVEKLPIISIVNNAQFVSYSELRGSR